MTLKSCLFAILFSADVHGNPVVNTGGLMFPLTVAVLGIICLCCGAVRHLRIQAGSKQANSINLRATLATILSLFTHTTFYHLRSHRW
jgi:hypothetical protein